MQAPPHRACGACNACCEVLPIDADGFQKTAGLLCAHCHDGHGCGIYETRPAPCRAFDCGWRQLSFVPEALRPDLSGVMILPDESAGVKFLITGGDDALSSRPFLECLAGFIHEQVPTYLAAPGPPGHFMAKTPLNAALAQAVAARDGGAIIARLKAALAFLAQGPFEKVTPCGQ